MGDILQARGFHTPPFLRPEEYLEHDSRVECRSECYDGAMFPMEATSIRRSEMQLNFVIAIRPRIDAAAQCRSFGPIVRVRLPSKRYAHPDVLVVDGKVELEDKKYDTVLNPTVLVEICHPPLATSSAEEVGDVCSVPLSEVYQRVEFDRQA